MLKITHDGTLVLIKLEGDVKMKNLTFVILITILAILSNMLTTKLCEIRINELQNEVDGVQYDMETLNEIIGEILK